MSIQSNKPKAQAKDPTWEAVRHISSFYDVPLEGLAELDGNPVVFFFHEETSRPDPQDPEDTLLDTSYSLYPLTTRSSACG